MPIVVRHSIVNQGVCLYVIFLRFRVDWKFDELWLRRIRVFGVGVGVCVLAKDHSLNLAPFVCVSPC